MKPTTILPAIITALAIAQPAIAEDDTELAKKLINPVADLISVPIRANIDFGLGAGGGHRITTNIQPVVPFHINDEWNVISRTILPVIDQNGLDFVGDASDAFGLGDTLQSFFFSPTDPEPFIWGIGPVFLLPTATDRILGTDKWGAGPTGVVLKMDGPWTYGALVNHVWDFAGDDNRAGVNVSFIQPFCAYTTDTATTFTLTTESTCDWQNDQWTVPVIFQVSQMIRPGRIPISLTAAARYYVECPDQGSEWGFRLGFTLLFPAG